MRVTTFLLFFCSFCMMASDLKSQEARVSIKKSNVALLDILNEIENQTNYLFIYSDEIDVKALVSVNVNNESLAHVLTGLLDEKSISYQLIGTHIILNPKDDVSEEKAVKQANTVTGQVFDQSENPLIGATVMQQGTSNGTVTDMDGRFELAVPQNATLVIHYIGYKTKLVRVGNERNFKVYLEEDTEALDEVVVVGYGTQKKVNLTGSVSAISAKDIQDIPVANTSSLLQGRLPGLTITNNGAQAGQNDSEFRIRGIGTFGNSNPMVLIDGVESSLASINDIPAADIENVSVLKDAASASIYGVRAANGVILITTKRGTEGKVDVSYSGNYTIQTPDILPTYVDSYNWALMRNEVRPGAYDATALQKLKDGSDPDHYANTDWLDQILRTAPMHQHHLSASGGNKNTHFMTSVSFSNQDGIMLNTGVKRIGFRTNVDSRYKRFSFGVNVSGNKNDVYRPVGSVSGDGGIMRYVSWFTRPTVPVKYSNGHYGYVDGSWTDAEAVKNPLDFLTRGHREEDQYRFNGKAFVGIDLYDGLKFQTSFAYNFYQVVTKTYSPKEPARYNAEGDVLKAESGNNQLTDYYTRNGTWTNENILTYDKTFGNHTINVLLGHSLIGYESHTTSASQQGFMTDNIYELNAGSKTPTVSGYASAYRLQSFFGRVKYNYADRYLFEFNVRHDGSSRMPKANRYGTFPSLSAGWVFSNEKFMEDYDWLFGKLRFSWGKLGNQEIGDYAYTSTLGASGSYYFDQGADPQIGMRQTSVANENIKWETTTTYNIAVDLGFFNNRLNTTFEWYDKKTSDILMQLSMPNIFLGSLYAPYQNVGTVRNRGWEWDVNYQDHKGDWNWYAGFNVASVKNKIKYFGGLEERISGQTINRVGEAIGSYYGLKAIGLYRTEADLNRTNSKGEVIKQFGNAPQLGDIMYEDLDDNGNVDNSDRDIIGNAFPKFNYGFNLGLGWKNFDLSTFWQGVAGLYRYSWESTTNVGGNMTDRWLDRWSTENPDGSMPRLGGSNNNQYSTFWLEKADYLRLKNLELGYTFKGVNKYGVSKLRVYFAATNLLTFTPLENYDPEKSSGDLRNDVHPNMKTFSFGLNINF